MMNKAEKFRNLTQILLDERNVETTITDSGNLDVAESDLHQLNDCVKNAHVILYQ